MGTEIGKKISCTECVFFIGEPHQDPRYAWKRCKQGVMNISKDAAIRCRYYTDDIEVALNRVKEMYRKRWFPKYVPTTYDMLNRIDDKLDRILRLMEK